MIKNITITFLFLATFSIYGQGKKLSAYKYIIVADKFDFLKDNDQYKTSSLTKFLLQKNGFEVFLSNENFPRDLEENGCLGLLATVTDDSAVFKVKNIIVLKDCSGAIVYTSKVGKSKEKDYKKGYHEAIRNAHASMIGFQYSYQAKEEVSPIKIAVIAPVVVKVIEKKIAVKIISDIKKELETPIKNSVVAKDVLSAQAIENGFQLVNTKPEVVFQILKTKNKDLYIIKDKNGILYKDGSSFSAQFYEGNTLFVKQYMIKF
jgi:hypothetical protein